MLPKIVAFVIITCVLSTLLTWVLVNVLKHKALDVPNERSMHSLPLPRGGGLAIFATFLLMNLLIAPPLAYFGPIMPLLLGAALLLGVSWLDDLRNLGPLTKFVIQIVAVVLGVFSLHGKVFQGMLPVSIDAILAGMLWLWFVNLFNFMDGIDGLAAGETVFITLGMYLLAQWSEPAILGAAALGFLFWNWSPAKIFLGDVGSVPLGYVLGAFLLQLAEAGMWAPALILPAYFIADSTITLVKRFYRGELIWQAHRQHFYQVAVQNGRSQRLVSGAVMGVNLLLIIIAIFSLSYPIYAFLSTILIVGVLLWWMAQKPGTIMRRRSTQPVSRPAARPDA